MTPFYAYIGTLNGLGSAVGQSSFWTFSVDNRTGFDMFLPIIVQCPGTTNISAGAEVTLYRSADGGGTWETQGSPGTVFSRPTTASQKDNREVLIPTGQFLVGVQVGGGVASTWSVQAATAWVITAYA